ncbi:SDR family oxidoreductase [Leifsonia kafniensis]|uniref:SDR family oxidoreductase n=1 Tax=Leifsonia kafniensis TaxID=475957 RepID=A0ABP7KQ50_9MICO
MRLSNKIAFITGAGSGMGLAAARLFAAEGATVYGADISSDVLDRQFAGIEGAIGVVVDISDSAQVNAAFEKVAEEQGRLDVLINAAGVHAPNKAAADKLTETNIKANEARKSGGDYVPEFLADITDEDFDRVMKINLYGSFYTIRAAVPLLKAAQGGTIVNFASVSAYLSTPMPVYYPASKAAILGLTRELAGELAPFNIRVNSLAPAGINTGMLNSLDPETIEFLMSAQPLKRFGTPEEVAEMLLFLCGENGTYYTGQTFSPSGGMVLL